MKPQRYNLIPSITLTPGINLTMSRADDGIWVKYEDYEKLKKENDRLWDDIGRD